MRPAAGPTCTELNRATPTDLQSPRCLVGLHKNLIKIPLDFHQKQTDEPFLLLFVGSKKSGH